MLARPSRLITYVVSTVLKRRSTGHRCMCSKQSVSLSENIKAKIERGPGLKDFIVEPTGTEAVIDGVEQPPYLEKHEIWGCGKKVHFEVYGCQMNVSDTEVVWSILKRNGFELSSSVHDADVILLVTCAIRDGAEQKVWNKLQWLRAVKKRTGAQIGVLGCMAERLKDKLVEREKAVDVVCGPDAYRDLPRLLTNAAEDGRSAVNVALSLDESYADITPVRLAPNKVTSFISIMRGCDNMCTYCIVPFTRGRERSRPIVSILGEVAALQEQRVKEITLLGQNVNSFRDTSMSVMADTKLAKGFSTVYKTKKGGVRFAELLRQVAEAAPDVRIRFTSPHPKDFPDEVLEVIDDHPNLCRCIHLPAQSGNSEVLKRMRRGYTREAYLELVERIQNKLPGVCFTSDFICGFCGETEAEFEDTISLMNCVDYTYSFLFAYSMRETSKRCSSEYFGRNDGNTKVIFSKEDISTGRIQPGDFIAVKITGSNSQTLKGTPLYHSTIKDYQGGLQCATQIDNESLNL